MLNATLTLAHRNIETQVHMAEVRATLNEVVHAAAHYSENCTEYEEPRTDGGVGMAFDNSIVRILDRLDKLMGDDARWSRDTGILKSAKVEAGVRVQHQAEQVDMLRYHNRPSVRLRATITPFQGAFVVQAPLGRGVIITGTGATVPEAMDQFDRAYHVLPAPPEPTEPVAPPEPPPTGRKARKAKQ